MTQKMNRWNRRVLIGRAVLVSVVALGCGPLPEGEPGTPHISEPEAPEGPEIDTVRVGFDAATAVRNLHSQIGGLEDALARNPQFHPYREQLVSLYLQRSRFLGSYATDFRRALALVTEARERRSDDAAAWRLSSMVERGLHLFDAAEASLDRAAAIDGADDLPARAALALARGEDLREHVATAKAQAALYPNPANLSFLAALLAGRGQFDDADAHYREALAAYRDNSPFFLARIAFQRGVMWGEMADRPEWARPLYEEAVRRLPDYVVANVHLAELEIEAEETLSAVARLERVLDAEDPEPEGRLAEYIHAGDAERAEALQAEARSTYDTLLESYPLAFADHASEFFSGTGADPQRALRLAEQNLQNRQDARAYLIAIRAALSARESPRACALLTQAQPLVSVHPVLASELSELAPTCP